MKKKIKLLGIILTIAVVGFFAACGDDPTPPYEVTLEGTNIKIVATPGVTNAQVDTAADMIDGLYTNTFNDTRKETFKFSITEIRVGVSGTAISHTGKVLTIAYNSTDVEIATYLFNNSLAQFNNTKTYITLSAIVSVNKDARI